MLKKQLVYWKTQLADLTVLELPTDKQRPMQLSYRGSGQAIHLSAALTQGLKTLSQKHNVTLFMTLLAAFQVLLHRYSGQDDIVVGTAIAGRNRQELENLIGFFVNTLVLRTDLSGTPSFVQLLSRVRDVCLNAYEHQDLPFEKLVAELQLQRDLSRNPLFQVMLVLQPRQLQAMQLPGLTISSLPLSNETAKFDLTLSLVENYEGLTGTIEYNTDLFNAETITRLIGHFQTLLEAVVEQPETSIAELPLLTAIERHQLLVEWNATQTDYPKDKCIHQLFEEQAASTPDAIALVFEDQHLSYRALNAKANQLAHYLRTLGTAPDSLIGICVERGLNMTIGILGILKAGGAYVPLDPTYPEVRLTFMLKDSAPALLLIETKTKDIFSEVTNNIPRIDLAADQAFWAGQPKINLSFETTGLAPEHLAYVIYTSGSTGQPKGAMNEHRSVVNRLNWMQSTYKLGLHDAVLQKTPFSFDVSVWEFFWPLFTGARLVIAKPEGHKEPNYLSEVIKSEKITTLHFVPSMLQVFLEHVTTGYTSLQRVICSGEELPSSLVKLFHERLPETELHNLYGPTEAAVDVTAWACVVGYPSPTIPIGRPIDNTQIYILDPHGSPVPIGITGELYIGGVQVGRGYLNQPELTAEKFISDPFSEDSGSRLYKTGDLARYLPDGTIEFLGRIDHQVKLRGFRIELGEIEAVLETYPGINTAVASVREDQPGDKRLIAYLTHAPLEQPNVDALRVFLKEKLPKYMVPSAFVFLDKLPLTPNGKLDRKALPAPDQTRPEFEQAYVPPRSPIEEIVAALWQEVLAIEPIGIHDNFFALGGHSLLTMQLMVRLNKQFQIELPLHLLFEEPTIAGLSTLLTTMLEQAPAANLEPIQVISREQPIPASFAQQRLWFLDHLLGASSLYNIPWAIQLNGKLDVSAVQQSLNAIVARHEVLRTCFVEQDGEPVQVINDSVDFVCPLMDFSTLPLNSQDGKTQELLAAEGNKPFALKEAPLIRATLFKLSEQEHILSVTFHHSVADGWSMGVFSRELASFYVAFSLGQAVANVPELPIQYADYTVWQHEWLQGEVLEKQLSYWKTQLADLTVLELPTDKQRPMQSSYRGSGQAIHLSAALTQGLKTLSQKHNVTLFMTLLAAFQILLHRYSAQDDIVVGTAIAGRNRQELENLIGFFVNTLVLRTDLSDSPNFVQLLSRVRDVCLNAYEHQDLPFEKLVAELHVQRDISRNPLFQVMLVLQPLELQAMQLPGLTISSFPLSNETAKFDLTLSLVENSEGLTGTLEYNTDLFNAETITRLIGHFQTLLEAVVEQPETSIAQLPLLTPIERHQLLVEWNATKTDYPKDKCIHQLFEEQAARTPDAIALVFEDQQLSYQALNAKANQLAHYLRTAGVKPDTLVAICMERSLDMVVCLLAILKAGGAYVPLDVACPQQRLEFFLNDIAAPLLLTQQTVVALLHNHASQLVCLDQVRDVIAQESAENLICTSTAENLAYVIYTSGSTGIPKGVSIVHRNTVALISWAKTLLAKEDVSKVLASTTYCFDLSIFEFFVPLTQGGCFVLVENILQLTGSESYEGITLINTVPSAITELLKMNKIPASVQTICLAGEPLKTALVDQLYKKTKVRKIIDLYGPTEDTTYSTVCIRQLGAKASIGTPIANTQIYILDKHLQPVPIGVSGEIHIGGDGLARGYLNRPELSAEKFIAHPFSDDSGSRLYKTGDLGRYQPDGTIEFLGRIDHQVKLRGFRIELGEIEAILESYPGINKVIVIVREDQLGDKRLIAYLTHEPLEHSNVDALRLFLKQKLPEYMMPSAFVFLDKLPLTPNGKLDRKALPAPDQTRPEFEQAYFPPSSPVEEMLVAIWREVLAIDKIGVHDNFFELGGHSLLILVLCTKIEANIGKSIPMSWVFRFPTISQLAVNLKLDVHVKDQKLDPIVTAFQRDSTLPPLFWAMSLESDASTILKHLNSNHSFYLLNHQSLDGITAKYTTIPDIARFYLKEILQINPDGPYYLFGYSIGGMIMYEIASQLCSQGKKVGLLFLLDPTSIVFDENDERYITKEKVTFFEKLQLKLKNEGYMLFTKICIYHAKYRMMLLALKFSIYLGKIPHRFHVNYVYQVYIAAAKHYRPEHPQKGIENTVMVHTKNRNMQDWISVFNGTINIYSIDCKHEALLNNSNNVIWLDIANSYLANSTLNELEKHKISIT